MMTIKFLPGLACCMILTLSLSAEEAAKSPLPPGIDSRNWIPITENLGFCVTGVKSTKDPNLTDSSRKAFLKTGQYKRVFNSVSGFYLIKIDSEWLRFEPPPQSFQVVPLK